MMSNKYLIGIDQSTQGTKAVLFDQNGIRIGRKDLAHQQIVDEKGWVEHNPIEIYQNIIQAVKDLIDSSGINPLDLLGVGVTNQRETAVVWDRVTGFPVYHAIVWQCARGEKICEGLENHKEMIKQRTGLPISPYFTAAKISWVLQNVEEARVKAEANQLAFGTMDSWVIYQLTKGRSYKTDYSNASRTQLFNIHTLTWDPEICGLFGINPDHLPEVCDSNGYYGDTDFEGYLPKPIPIHSVMGDSHGALFGQQCLEPGMVKATYGTGSSIMMNIGTSPILSDKGIVTSLAWSMDGVVNYVLEGNINYSGAVIRWLKDLGMIQKDAETQALAFAANPADTTYLIPAFTGLGAPYWKSNAKAMIYGMSRTTGKGEIVRAALDSMAYQITDIIQLMEAEAEMEIKELRVDGGPTKNKYLMQFQSDMLQKAVGIPTMEELSVIGVIYMAGLALGLYDGNQIFESNQRTSYQPMMEEAIRKEKQDGWREALAIVIS